MSVMMLTKKEFALLECARMILADQCPPDRKHYLCMVSEDCTGDCTQCWGNYLREIGTGTIDLTNKKTEAEARRERVC